MRKRLYNQIQEFSSLPAQVRLAESLQRYERGLVTVCLQGAPSEKVAAGKSSPKGKKAAKGKKSRGKR